VLVEEYLSGREFTVALIGDQRAPRMLPPMEIVFVGEKTKHPVYSFGNKLDWSKHIRYDRPANTSAGLAREIESVARAAWHALGCRDVARIDVRQNAGGELCFIECNPLPGLTPNWSDLCLIAESASLPYMALVAEIMAPAFSRREKKLQQSKGRV
jgi:D-alanine-D-alanine ligase